MKDSFYNNNYNKICCFSGHQKITDDIEIIKGKLKKGITF